jgi:hypothetical protein
MKKWEAGLNNEVLQGDGFYISYNSHTGRHAYSSVLTVVGNILKKLHGDGKYLKNGEETALVLESLNGRRAFYILEGDFRKEYEKLLDKGFETCKKFYDSKPELHSNWSTSVKNKK